MARTASAEISPAYVRRLEQLVIGLAERSRLDLLEVRGEMEAVRTECLQAVRARDLHRSRDTGRKLERITIAHDSQQCQLIALQETVKGLVRDGCYTRADIARLSERVDAGFLDMTLHDELAAIVLGLEGEFAVLTGEEPASVMGAPPQGGEVRGVRTGPDRAGCPYGSRTPPRAVPPPWDPATSAPSTCASHGSRTCALTSRRDRAPATRSRG